MARAENLSTPSTSPPSGPPSGPGAEIVVMTGPPPQATLGCGLRAADELVIAQARTLRPSEWFYWPSPPGTWKKHAKKYLADAPVVVYRSVPDRRVVIKHRDSGPTTPAPAPMTTPTAPPARAAAVPADRRSASLPAPVAPREVDEEPGEVGDGGGGGGGGEEGSEGHLHGIVLALTTRQATLIRSYHREPDARRTIAELGAVLNMARGYPDEVQSLTRRKLLEVTTRADDRKVYGLTPLGRDVLSHLTGAKTRA